MHNYKLDTALKPAHQSGLSLIELMIAMALGLIVILGVTQSMTTLLASSRVQLDRNDLAQNTDIATNFLGYQFRNSLSAPCDSFSRLDEVYTHAIDGAAKNGSGDDINIDTGMASTISKLIKAQGIEALTKSRTINGKSYHSDEILLISSPKKLQISTDSGMEGEDLVIDSKIDEKDVLFTITNCYDLSLFRASAKYSETNKKTTLTLFDHGSEGKTKFDLNYRTIDRSMVSPLSARKIFINEKGQLFNRSIYNTSSPALFEGVELIRALFGVDRQGRDGIVDTYVTAKQLNDMIASNEIEDKDSLISIELFILAKTNKGKQITGLPAEQKFNMPDTSKEIQGNGKIPTEEIIFKDKTMRQIFTRTITFRSQAAI